MNEAAPLPVEIVSKFMENVPVDVRGLAKELGIHVKDERLPETVSGKIECDWLGDFTITVNAAHGENRKRFSIAHEIAHYILHRDKIGDGITDDAMYRSNRSDAIERQANQYAAQILMPWRKVVCDEAFQSRNATRLAEHFQVSTGVAEIRLRELEVFG